MYAKAKLPSEVITAIEEGHKIEAIKRLREAKGLGLKEAKQEVDAYMDANPSIRQPKSGANGLIFIVVVGLLGYAAYQLTK